MAPNAIKTEATAYEEEVNNNWSILIVVPRTANPLKILCQKALKRM
jgi:hypothetical protein